MDDNNRVKKGDLLVQLDKEPFQDAVAVKTAAVGTAQANLAAAKAAARGSEAQARKGAGICNTPRRRWKIKYRCCAGLPASK